MFHFLAFSLTILLWLETLAPLGLSALAACIAHRNFVLRCKQLETRAADWHRATSACYTSKADEPNWRKGNVSHMAAHTIR